MNPTLSALSVVFLLLSRPALTPADPAQDGKDPIVKKDQLGPGDPYDIEPTTRHRKVFEHKMEQGKTYALEVTTKDYDVHLRVENSAGVQVGAGDNQLFGGGVARL